MRTVLIAAVGIASVIGLTPAAPAGALELSPTISPGHPSLGSVRGRWTLCRIHLEQQGYPYSYLRVRGSRGILSACSRELWRKHHRIV